MKNLFFSIPNYVPDLGGAASMLMELGGLVIFHDAAGCCENYTVYDEPRWFGSDSMVYSSSLQQLDAVLGDDEPLICSTAAAAEKLNPSFLALVGTPVPAVIGMDLDGIAAEMERRCKIPAFAVHTSGFDSYEKGAGEALETIIRRFAGEGGEGRSGSLNLLGATPLDFSEVAMDRIRENLVRAGYAIHGVFCMGASLAEIRRIADAEKNLVISRSGLPAARYLKERFGMEYVQAVPFTRRQAETLSLLPEKGIGRRCLVIGEALASEFLADALSETKGWRTDALPAGLPEEEAAEAMAAGYGVIVADPFYEALLPPGAELLALPHRALSARLFPPADLTGLLSADKAVREGTA